MLFLGSLLSSLRMCDEVARWLIGKERLELGDEAKDVEARMLLYYRCIDTKSVGIALCPVNLLSNACEKAHAFRKQLQPGFNYRFLTRR